MDWYIGVLKKYAVFEGRARRKEYWMFILFNFLISIAIGIVEGFAGSNGIISIVYALAIFLPSLAVTIRRLHDTNRAGWWFLIAFVPVVGGIILLIFMVLEGTSGSNDYGADPKA